MAVQRRIARALAFWACLSACFMFLIHQNLNVEPPIFLRKENYLIRNRPTRGAPPSETSSAMNEHSETPSFCVIPPGEDSTAEIGFQGYSLLINLRYDLARAAAGQQYSPRLLCIFPRFSSSEMQQAGLKTYGKSCQGVFVVSEVHPREIAPASEKMPQNVHYVQAEVDDSPEAMLRYAAKQFLEDYDWFHVARPGRYLLVERARERISNITQTESQPMALKSIMPRELNANVPTYDRSHDRPELCWGANTFNRAALQAYVQALPKTASIADWVSAAAHDKNISCEHGFGEEFELYKFNSAQKLFTEIDMNSNLTSTQQAAAIRRIYAILHGECDEQWDVVLGALDESGRSGYVHDVTYLRKHPPPFNHHPNGFDKPVCDTPFSQGIEGVTGYKGLQKIKIATQGQDMRVLCMVYTHSESHHRLRAIGETWGARCDGFFAASNLTDTSIGAVHLLHEGPEEYGNMWLKVRAMWQYAYDNYLNDYDVFHIGGDDHYVIVENLRFLASFGNWKGPWDHNAPLYLGGSLAVSKKRRYCGGGSGYTLNRVALKMLVEKFYPRPACRPHWRSSKEDLIAAACFRDGIGLQCMDTNDAFNESRYHPWDVDFHASWRKGRPANWYPKDLENQGIAQPGRLGQISEMSVSFHLRKPKQNPNLPPDSGMRRYHAILYGICETNVTVSRSLVLD